MTSDGYWVRFSRVPERSLNACRTRGSGTGDSPGRCARVAPSRLPIRIPSTASASAPFVRGGPIPNRALVGQRALARALTEPLELGEESLDEARNPTVAVAVDRPI